VAVCRQKYGDRDPTTLASISDLGTLLLSMEDAAALPLLEEACEGLRRTEGNTHKLTLRATVNLAKACSQMGAGSRAMARLLYEQVCVEWRRVWPSSPFLFNAMGDLSNIIFNAGDPAAALTLREEACAAARRELGDAHPCTVHQRGCLARTREHPYTLSRFSSSIRAKGVLVGLLSKPELNGSAVVVVGFDVAKGRYCVRHDRVVAGLKEISAGKPLAVKPACLVFEQGIAVIVEDLNAQPEWNGKRGLVKSFDSEKRRYQLLFTGRKKPLNVSPRCLKLEFAVEAEQRAREATRRARVEANVRAALAARSPAPEPEPRV
jgi:hypothetical protein